MEGRQGLGGQESGRSFRLRPTSGGAPWPASHRRLTSLPSGRPGPRAGLPAPAPHLRELGFQWQRLPPLTSGPPLGFGDSGIPSQPDPQPSPADPPPTRRLYLLRERAEGVEAEAASSSMRRSAAIPQPFPAAATVLSSTAQGWRAAAAARGRRTAGARRGDTAALRPAGEEQPRSNQPREGGWAAEWGGVSEGREWLPRRPGESLLSASPTHAGSRPRPLVRPRAPLGRVGPPRRASPGDPCPRALPPLPLPTESGPRPGRFCCI